MALRKAFARKKVALQLAAATASLAPDPRLLSSLSRVPRLLDEFNNNAADVEVLDGNERDYSGLRDPKLRASRTLPAGLVGFERVEFENGDALGADDDETIVPERNGAVENFRDNNAPNAKSNWFDYSEVGKWVQNVQASIKETPGNNKPVVATQPVVDDADKSLNEILTQVVDKIYEDTHAKLAGEQQQQQQQLQINRPLEENGNSLEMDTSDNQTYAGRQTAMKNPVWVRAKAPENSNAPDSSPAIIAQSPIISITADVPPPRPPPPVARIKRDVFSADTEEPLPPLPPKRIRKTPSMPTLPRAASSQALNHRPPPPQKTLPTPPSLGNDSPGKPSKPGLFSKLFSRKSKRDEKDPSALSSSTTSLPAASAKEDNASLRATMPAVRALAAIDQASGIEGDVTPPYGADLTEAEHYALYMAMAPHATASEFDEMSFYYSPVEGGKILEAREAT